MRIRSRRLKLVLTPFGVAAYVLCAACPAATIHVDNVQGSDMFDGSTSTPFDNDSGPVRTIGRALKLARAGDRIVLANHGKPYYESIQLVGRRHSGYEHVKFTLVGNGAVLSGLKTIPPAAWRRVGRDLWKVTPWRKGHYQLLLDGEAVPEHRRLAGTGGVASIPAGRWSVWRGSIFYRAPHLEEPSRQPFQFAHKSVGLTLYKVHDVRIIDVTFRHFRVDGVNAHGFCRNVELDGVNSLGNGRAGVSVNGTSQIVIRNSRITDNRLDQLRIAEFGVAEVDQTEMSAPPTIVE